MTNKRKSDTDKQEDLPDPEEVIKRMLNTPPTPHKPDKRNQQKQKSNKKPA